jgi:hypothetical protein
MRAQYPAHLIILNLLTRIIFPQECSLWNFSLFSLHCPDTLFLLGSNIFLDALFSNTLSLCFTFNVGDQVSSQYKKNRQGYIFLKLICIFGHETGRQNILDQMVTAFRRVQSARHFSFNLIFIC